MIASPELSAGFTAFVAETPHLTVVIMKACLRIIPLAVTAGLISLGCGKSSDPAGGAGSSAPSASAAATPSGSVAAGAQTQTKELKAPVREGSTIARSASDDALYVADEDHGVVRRVALPLDPNAPAITEISVPGAPAQVLALGDRVLVTVRDPGLLLIMRPDPQKGLVEAARVELPADAWGVAVTPDEKTALVTSAWTHQVSAVDIESGKKRWSIDVPREPRAVVARPDGASAYVTHLTGSSITRIDDIGGTPAVKAVALPPDPVRAPSGKTLNASLAYSAVLSDDGKRLFVPRHALGAIGKTAWQEAWFGTSTVDVLVTATDKPIIGKRVPGLPKARTAELEGRGGPAGELSVSAADFTPFIQPRAAVYRKTTKTVLVAGEGDDVLAELNAQSVSPALQRVRSYKIGSKYDKFVPLAGAGGAPSGVALSADEKTAYVFCRSTYDIAVVALGDPDAPRPEKKEQAKEEPPPTVHLADDPHDKDVAMGRRLFYNATDTITSGGIGCAGCHPEGRDDGHIWHEADFEDHMVFFGEPENTPAPATKDVRGFPRQTPMLAGRVNAKGPYGWKAQNADLYERLKEGFGLHRWAHDNRTGAENELRARAGYLTAFLRKGVATPPPLREARDLTEVEQKGKQIFMSEKSQCAKCHVPETDYTDREKYAFKRKKPPQGFDDEPKNEFKTPSLKFVVGTPPYLHDGTASTLEHLIEHNNDWMGKTNHLSKEEQAALVAFLKTL